MAKMRCRYEYSRPYGNPVHTWSVVGSLGGLHLHIEDYGEDKPEDRRYSGGLEIHWRTPLLCMNKDAPSQDHCWLLRAPCWHDGSSLIVTEHWIPLWLADPHNHDRMFGMLRSRLAEEEARQAGDDHGEGEA